jgi:hypothetical protein
MTDNDRRAALAWKRAYQVLSPWFLDRKHDEHEQNWPDSFSPKEISFLQYPPVGDQVAMDRSGREIEILLDQLEIDIAKGHLATVQISHVDRVTFQPAAPYLNIERAPLAVWLVVYDIEPSAHLVAWLGETLQPTQAPESGGSEKPRPPAVTAVKVEAASIKRLMRGALTDKHEHHWPTIENDFRHSDENGLAKVAGLPEHGFWNEITALQWAEERGKLTGVSKPKANLLDAAWRGVKRK